MCILLNVKKHEKTFALNVDIFSPKTNSEISLTTIAANAKIKKVFGTIYFFGGT